MKEKDYIFLSTFYDKELLRRAVLALNEENIDFEINDKSKQGHFRAPLSTYIEADIMVPENHYKQAYELLNIE